VRQGRVIFGNIRRFVLFLLSCNAAEVLVVATAPLVALPLPVLPLQLLFLNLVTDVFPALALGMGEGDPRVMERPPRDPRTPILGRRHWIAVALYAAAMAGAVYAALVWALHGLRLTDRQSATVAFLTLALAQLWHVFNMRARGSRPFADEVARNPWIWGALALCLGMVLLAVYTPPLAAVLRLESPGLRGWGVVAAMSLLPLLLGQLAKGGSARRKSG
jgi:Ca2+-transporting ATPase